MDPTTDNQLEAQPRSLEQPAANSATDEKDSQDALESRDALDESKSGQSAFKGLGWLDRLLALWILLAMIIGILLGNYVPSVGPALHRGELIGVSIPIGECTTRRVQSYPSSDCVRLSHWPAGYDVSNPVQSAIRKPPSDS